jgi:hypothetical protein
MSEHKKMIPREMYEELLRLQDDGCPLVMDLDEYEIIDEAKKE